jgi:hypothetical protein
LNIVKSRFVTGDKGIIDILQEKAGRSIGVQVSEEAGVVGAFGEANVV